MYIDVTKSMFRDTFHRLGRASAWSYDGLGALYDYLIELEEDTGNGVEFDVIALDCEFAEYELEEFKEEHDGPHFEDYVLHTFDVDGVTRVLVHEG